MKNNFIFHRNWWDALIDEDDSLIGAFVRHLCRYAFDGNDSEPRPELRLTVRHAISEMKRDMARYKDTCEKNRHNVMRRWEQKKDTTVYDRIPPNTKRTDNDNDNDNDNDSLNNNKEYIRKSDELPDYVSPAFAHIMKEWLAYKRERSQAYKPRGLQACYTKLVNLSGNDPAKARAIVEQSMSNNYSGLFQLKIQDNGNNNNFRRTPADNIREAQEQHIRQLAESVSQAADRNGKVYESLPFD